ncbi:MAG: BrnT family toxin [Alphaproteobacteria bacterium]|nr:BrnT family toxin [Alphaproteobacteria bacterium]
MRITFDPVKNARNIAKHGLDFERAYYFDWSAAQLEIDTRKDYGEPRYNAVGMIDGELCFMSFTYRDGNARVISLRTANKKERKHYEKTR